MNKTYYHFRSELIPVSGGLGFVLSRTSENLSGHGVLQIRLPDEREFSGAQDCHAGAGQAVRRETRQAKPQQLVIINYVNLISIG